MQYEFKTQELTIPAGERSIYGRIWLPVTEETCPAVILSHGYNGCHSDFNSECAYFARNGFIACSFDFCGGSTRSKSSGKSTDMTVFTEKEDLLAVLDYIAAMPCSDSGTIFLMGGSQGGLVTALATEERMEQVRGMVLYFPAFNIPDDWRRNFTKAEDIPETLDFWGLTLGRNFFLSMRDFSAYDCIGSFPKEVLILQGDEDRIVAPAVAGRAAEKYAHAELVILKGEEHGFSPEGAKTAMEKALQMMQSTKAI